MIASKKCGCGAKRFFFFRRVYVMGSFSVQYLCMEGVGEGLSLLRGILSVRI